MPTQTKLPQLRRVKDTQLPDVRPPSYVMEPTDMGIDLFEPHPDGEDASATGLVRRAPIQMGAWKVQPSYSSALPFIVDADRGKMWTRTHQPTSDVGWYSEAIIREVNQHILPDEVRWLHCLRIAARPSNILAYTAIVVDFIHPTMPASERRLRLENSFYPQGVRNIPESGKVRLIPEFSLTHAEDLWGGLHLQNTEWTLGLYDGLILKQHDARYSMQLDDHTRKTLKWQFYPFVDKFAETDEV